MIAPESDLTPKQRQVLDCLLQGLCDKQMCDVLKIKRCTLRKRFEGLFAKFSIRGRVGLAVTYRERRDAIQKDSIHKDSYRRSQKSRKVC